MSWILWCNSMTKILSWLYDLFSILIYHLVAETIEPDLGLSRQFDHQCNWRSLNEIYWSFQSASGRNHVLDGCHSGLALAETLPHGRPDGSHNDSVASRSRSHGRPLLARYRRQSLSIQVHNNFQNVFHHLSSISTLYFHEYIYVYTSTWLLNLKGYRSINSLDRICW